MIFGIQKRGLAFEALFDHRGWTLLSCIVPENASSILRSSDLIQLPGLHNALYQLCWHRHTFSCLDCYLDPLFERIQLFQGQ